jgi:hypothetical protein
MAIKCPECGYEITNRSTSDALQKFYQDLRDGDDKQDVDAISNFPVPNTKEDFIEFLLYAKGALETGYTTSAERKKYNAWKNKFFQMKLKASILFKDDKATLNEVNLIIAIAS